MKTLIVDKKYNEKKLNKFLLENFDGLNINHVYKALRKKDIRVNNIRINENIMLHEGDEVTIFIPDELLFKKINLDIVYEDSNIIIFNKPSGIETTGDNSLTSYLNNLGTYDFVEPCHRLDRNTTGLVLYAKNQKALDIVINKFKNREIEKHYMCLVHGVPSEKQKILTAYLFKDSKNSIVYVSDIPKKGYQKIITSYIIMNSDIKNDCSILKVQLHTGRTHQIRAHLAHVGHPIIGDRKIRIN